MDIESSNKSSLVWKALADPTRRRILDLLAAGPSTTGSLCKDFELTRFAIMKHLRVLEEADLIQVERRGRERWNHLERGPLQRIVERWLRPRGALTSPLPSPGREVGGGPSSPTGAAQVPARAGLPYPGARIPALNMEED